MGDLQVCNWAKTTSLQQWFQCATAYNINAATLLFLCQLSKYIDTGVDNLPMAGIGSATILLN